MTDKELNSELNEEECDVVDDYTIGFATYLMQKRRDEVDRLQSEIKRLKKENKKFHIIKEKSHEQENSSSYIRRPVIGACGFLHVGGQCN